MDYQRNGWYRPTCGIKCPQMTPYQNSARPSAPCHENPVEACDSLPSITPSSLAMVWSPLQSFQKIYEPAKALSRGTLFAELDKPFSGKC